MTLFKRAQFKELVSLYADSRLGGYLSHDELLLIHGALDLQEKNVRSAMIEIQSVYMISFDRTLDYGLLDEIIKSGYSRIPVFKEHRENVVGALYVKSLVRTFFETKGAWEGIPISKLKLRELPIVSHTMPLYDMLNEFQTGKSHMALIVEENNEQVVQNSIVEETKDNSRTGTGKALVDEMNDPKEVQLLGKQKICTTALFKENIEEYKKYKLIGVITLEDIIEEIIEEEILDEADRATHVVPKRHNTTTPSAKQGLTRAASIKNIVKRMQASLMNKEQSEHQQLEEISIEPKASAPATAAVEPVELADNQPISNAKQDKVPLLDNKS